jgi:hypothetical protein
VINGAADQMPRDVAIESQFSPPLFSATAFGEPTPYKQVPVGAVKVNVTPVGNPGVLEIDTTATAVAGQRTTMLFGGASGTLLSMFAVDDGRRFNREANIRFLNANSQFAGIDFYVGLPDSDLSTLFPLATVLSPGISGYTTLHPGEYDLYLRQAGTLNTLMGPTRFGVAAGGTYGVLAVDGPDTTTANALFLDDFP